MLHMQSLRSAVIVLCVIGNAMPAHASIFLGKVPVHLQANVELEHVLLGELEGALGTEHRTFTEKRLAAIKKVVQPVFAALPKNEYGKLGSAATSYALFRVFLARHAWFVIGLEPFKAMASWNASSPTSVLDQRVPEFITGLFSTRLGKAGFGVHELSVLAATLEHFVHKESLVRLNAAYKSLSIKDEDVLAEEEVEKVMDTYMALYVLGPLVKNMSTVSTQQVKNLVANASKFYPGFPETQQFLRDVQQSVAPKRDYFYYSDVASLVEEVGDRYGRWQDYECRQIKDMLTDIEDKDKGGAGRVRLADFYSAALNDGKWQLCETVDYLRQLGALDESDPDNLRVIIPNYVNGPSNCVASSSYYSVCCINECDELLGHIETKVAAPDASPERILALVSALPSSTVPGNRTLSPWLVHRLKEVATHHGGQIPLHGRLFGQWMHYAFPRECPFPHVLGTTKPQTAEAWVKETRQDFAANKTQMQHYISLPKPQPSGWMSEAVSETGKVTGPGGESETKSGVSSMAVSETGEILGAIEDVASVESAMWTMQEELVVYREVAPVSQSSVSSWARGAIFVATVFSALLALKRTVDPKLATVSQGEKVLV